MKNKSSIFTIIILTFTFLIFIAPTVFAKTRSSYLIDYIYSNQGLTEESGELFGETYEDTAQALEILKYYQAFTIESLFGVENKVDQAELRDYLNEQLEEIFDSNTIVLYEVFNILRSLDLIGFVIDNALNETIEDYLNSCSHNDGGFRPNDTSDTRDLTSTFYAYQIYDLLGIEFPNLTIHKSWILDCSNLDGGYGGTPTLPSTILTTYYATFLIGELDNVDALISKSKTSEYFSSLYVNDEYDFLKNGGYLPTAQSIYPLLSSTFLCTAAINYIDHSKLNESATIDWVIYRQNHQDGGFSDKFTYDNQELSSIRTSYYAFKTLILFGAEALLNENAFMVEFDFLILTIVCTVFGALVIIGYVIWRKRKI